MGNAEYMGERRGRISLTETGTLPTTLPVLPQWFASSTCSYPQRERSSPTTTSCQITPGYTCQSTRSWSSPTCWGWSPWPSSGCNTGSLSVRRWTLELFLQYADPLFCITVHSTSTYHYYTAALPSVAVHTSYKSM